MAGYVLLYQIWLSFIEILDIFLSISGIVVVIFAFVTVHEVFLAKLARAQKDMESIEKLSVLRKDGSVLDKNLIWFHSILFFKHASLCSYIFFL